MISVLLPSRGRPESLLRAVSSFAHGDVEVIVGLDGDDPTWPQALEAVAGKARILVQPRHESLPHLQNFLASQAKGDFLLPVPDDYVVEQEDWAARTMAAIDKLPNRLGIAFLNDPMYPGFTTFPVIPRRLVEMQGWLMAPFFPFLFTDTWWNEVAILSGCAAPADVTVRILAETGHDHRYSELALWAGLFEALRPMRISLALDILAAIGIEPGLHETCVRTLPQRIAACERIHADWHKPEFVARLERLGAYEPSPGYRAMRAKAEIVLPQLKALAA